VPKETHLGDGAAGSDLCYTEWDVRLPLDLLTIGDDQDDGSLAIRPDGLVMIDEDEGAGALLLSRPGLDAPCSSLLDDERVRSCRIVFSCQSFDCLATEYDDQSCDLRSIRHVRRFFEVALSGLRKQPVFGAFIANRCCLWDQGGSESS